MSSRWTKLAQVARRTETAVKDNKRTFLKYQVIVIPGYFDSHADKENIYKSYLLSFGVITTACIANSCLENKTAKKQINKAIA